MGVRRRPLGWAVPGEVLVALGCLCLVVSYLLPLSVCGSVLLCGPQPSYTYAWDATVRMWPGVVASSDMQSALGAAFLLVVTNLPVLAAVTMLGASIGFLVHPDGRLVTWNRWAWRLGISAVVILFLPVHFISVAGLGYTGMWVGYGVLWGGNHLLYSAQS